ncbi:MAG: competence protein ComJ [Chloroflexota bacterium]
MVLGIARWKSVYHGQLFVTNGGWDTHYDGLEWTQRRLSQGFFTGPRQIAFLTLSDALEIDLSIREARCLITSVESHQSVLVPFTHAGGTLTVFDIGGPDDGVSTDVAAGDCGLLIECWPIKPELDACRLTLIHGWFQEPRVLVAGDRLDPEYPLEFSTRPFAGEAQRVISAADANDSP